jgi:hypothetical protein
MLRNQRAILESVTDGLQLPFPAIAAEIGAAYCSPNGSETFDILDTYLRPQTQWDPPGPRDTHAD